jgi:hypothetical protein
MDSLQIPNVIGHDTRIEELDMLPPPARAAATELTQKHHFRHTLMRGLWRAWRSWIKRQDSSFRFYSEGAAKHERTDSGPACAGQT